MRAGPSLAVTRRKAGQVELFFAETPNGWALAEISLKLVRK